MPATELVGPLKRVWFSGHVWQSADLPRSTMDLRYRACIEHRTACDCREASFAEERDERIAEMHAVCAEMHAVCDVFADALMDHLTFGDLDAHGEPLESGCCQCQGCAIARELYRRRCVQVLPWSAWAKARHARRPRKDGSWPLRRFGGAQ